MSYISNVNPMGAHRNLMRAPYDKNFMQQMGWDRRCTGMEWVQAKRAYMNGMPPYHGEQGFKKLMDYATENVHPSTVPGMRSIRERLLNV